MQSEIARSGERAADLEPAANPPGAPSDRPAFELGLNYWPGRTAMYMWRDFDPVVVRDDMAHISDIGFDSVRIFPLAEDFLPAPMTVASAMLARLVQTAGAAKDAGLSVVPTLLVLNMSGRIWWPDWMLTPSGGARNIYSDPLVLSSLVLLAEACAGALAGDDSIRALDLANEIDDAQRPPSRESARTWLKLLTDAVKRTAPGIPLRIGAHLPSLTSGNNMRIDDLASVLDEDVMHAYPLYCDAARSPLDPELVPFACALSATLARSNRAVLMQEFGLCTAPRGSAGYFIDDEFLGNRRSQYLASEEEGATYFHEVLQRLVSTGAAGAYAWCYSDYTADLFDRPPLAAAVRERTFGLLRADGSEKPAADVFRRFRAARNAGQLARGPIPGMTDVAADNYYEDPGANFERLYRQWLTEHDC
jgi:endo-1,4-beta-mannosidase